MGADRAVHVNDPEIGGSDALGIAKVLAAVAKEVSPDLVLMGLMSDDVNATSVAPMLAELMGVPNATSVMKAELSEGKVLCERELEGGALEVVELPTPCVLAVQTGLNQVRYASLKGIMAAKKKPMDEKTAADLGLSGQVGAAAAKVRIEKIYVPEKGEGAEIIEGTTGEVVEKLVGKIKELGLL
jgi:electron transfer flavoprotein beta subunit